MGHEKKIPLLLLALTLFPRLCTQSLRWWLRGGTQGWGNAEGDCPLLIRLPKHHCSQKATGHPPVLCSCHLRRLAGEVGPNSLMASWSVQQQQGGAERWVPEDTRGFCLL